MFVPPYGGVNFPYKSNLNWIITMIQNLLDITGSLEEAWKAFQEKFQDQLDDTITKIIQDMIDSGELENLLNKHLTSGYINVVAEGARNDGVTNTGAIINTIISNNPGRTYYFPPGTYNIETPIIINQNTPVKIIIDNQAILKAAQNIDAVINLMYTPERMCTITGGGIIDMNKIAAVGILVSNRMRYTVITNIHIENADNGIGIQIGTDDGASTSTLISNIAIRASTSVANMTGIEAYAFDNFITNVLIMRTYTGIYLHKGGNIINGVHIWSDLSPESTTYAQSYAINNEGLNNLLDNIYADNFLNSIRTTNPLSIGSMFTYFPYTPNGQLNAYAVRASQAVKVTIESLYMPPATNYIMHVFDVSGGSSTELYGSKASFSCKNLMIQSSNGFAVKGDEGFNIRNSGYQTALINSITDKLSVNYYLLGYVSRTSGYAEFIIGLGATANFKLKILCARTGGLTPSVEIITDNAQLSNLKIAWGNAEDGNPFELIPIYLQVSQNTFPATILTIDPVLWSGEFNFYKPTFANTNDAIVTSPSIAGSMEVKPA